MCTHTRSPPDPAVCYLGGESALWRIGRQNPWLQLGIGLLWLFCFFSLFLHIPIILGKLGPGMNSGNQGQCSAKAFTKPMSMLPSPEEAILAFPQGTTAAESSQLLLYIKTVWPFCSHSQPNKHQAPEKKLQEHHPPFPLGSHITCCPHYKHSTRDFPFAFQCRGCGSDHQLGSYIPRASQPENQTKT